MLLLKLLICLAVLQQCCCSVVEFKSSCNVCVRVSLESNYTCPQRSEINTTLNHYARNQNICANKDDISLFFQEGNHPLNESLVIKHCKSVTMETHPNLKATIHLRSNMTFTNISETRLSQIQIVSNHSKIRFENTSEMIKFESVVFDRTLIDNVITVEQSFYEFKLHVTVIIVNSTFLSSKISSNFRAECVAVCMNISHSEFVGKFNGSVLKVSTQGLSSFKLQMTHTNITDMNIKSTPKKPCSEFVNEQHDILLDLSAKNMFIHIDEGIFSRSNSECGAWMSILLNGRRSTANLSISRANVFNYQQGGMSLRFSVKKLYVKLENILVERCKCTTSLSYSSAFAITNNSFRQRSMHCIIMQNCRFLSNEDLHGEAITVWLHKVTNINISNCTFRGNKGSAIQAYYSNFILSDNVMFDSNSAARGGALSLISSTMNIDTFTHVKFCNNAASKSGGAIFIDQRNRDLYEQNTMNSNSLCFYQLTHWNYSSIAMDYTYPSNLSFSDNKAKFGQDIFGACLKSHCVVYHDHTQVIRSREVQDGLFNLNENTYESDNPSQISSTATRLCFCKDNVSYECSNSSSAFSSISAYPGQPFEIGPMVLVGAEFGVTNGSFYSQVFNLSENNQPKHHKVDNAESGCFQFEYTIHSQENTHEVLILTASDDVVNVDIESARAVIDQDIGEYNNYQCIPPGLLSTPVFINVTMEACPTGFLFNSSTKTCECSTNLHCSLQNGLTTVNRENSTWVYLGKNKSIRTKHCPFDYCNHSSVSVTLTEKLSQPDEQCANNHSGTLCGECKSDNCILLGCSKCGYCKGKNNHLAFIVLFIILGLLLVFIIKALDLTVKNGTINGLIFYANIVWTYKSILLHSIEIDLEFEFFQSVKIFIGWLNLDFGIEVCFFDKLNAYHKTWLQFVFPLYIWSIIIVLIIVCRFSVRMTALFGNNAVAVLATLFLLSYVKMLQTIMSIFHFISIDEPIYNESNETLFWSVDGSPYWDPKHKALFVIAIIVLIIICIPYTLFLLFGPCVKGCICARFVPLFDAYYGPLKKNHRYSVGALLIIRALLLITFVTINATTGPKSDKINIYVMVLTIVFLLCYESLNPYRKWQVTVLESLFLGNLVFIGAVYLVNLDKGKGYTIFGLILLAFVKFVVILSYHLWTRVLVKLIRRCRNYVRDYWEIEGGNFEQPQANTISRVIDRNNVTQGEATISISHSCGQLRESILTDNPTNNTSSN